MGISVSTGSVFRLEMFCPDERGRGFCRNVGNYVSHYTGSNYRRTWYC